MKNIYLILSALMLSMLISSCDEVDAPYTMDDPIDFVPDSVPRKVLIEDFTGHLCGNCPEAADEAEHIKESFPGQVFIIAIHAGSYSRTVTPAPYDFKCEEGVEIDDFFGVSKAGNPNGMINRTEFDGERILLPNSWGQAVYDQLQTEAVCSIDLNVSYDELNFKITADVEVTYLKDMTANHNLSLMILEDYFESFQVDDRKSPPNVEDYIHHNVLRGGMNGTWGEAISTNGEFYAGDVFTFNIEKTIPQEHRILGSDPWIPENLKIIAYVHDYQASYEILQVEEKALFPEN